MCQVNHCLSTTCACIAIDKCRFDCGVMGSISFQNIEPHSLSSNGHSDHMFELNFLMLIGGSNIIVVFASSNAVFLTLLYVVV